MVDEAVARVPFNVLRVFQVGGDCERWNATRGTIEQCPAANIFPYFLVLDGAVLLRKLTPPPHDNNYCHNIDASCTDEKGQQAKA
eukprot:2680934-Pyramimonas_sp.AAC.1